MMKKFWGSQHIEVLDYHDGILENTKEVREKVAGLIQAWNADIVFTSTRPGLVIMTIILPITKAHLEPG